VKTGFYHLRTISQNQIRKGEAKNCCFAAADDDDGILITSINGLVV
jgi:hypothetical protein